MTLRIYTKQECYYLTAILKPGLDRDLPRAGRRCLWASELALGSGGKGSGEVTLAPRVVRMLWVETRPCGGGGKAGRLGAVATTRGHRGRGRRRRPPPPSCCQPRRPSRLERVAAASPSSLPAPHSPEATEPAAKLTSSPRTPSRPRRWRRRRRTRRRRTRAPGRPPGRRCSR